MSSFIRFLMGSLMGGLIGAIIGLLLAPRRGAETRSIIRNEFDALYNGSKLQHTLDDKVHTLKEKAKQVTEELEETGRRYLEPHEKN